MINTVTINNEVYIIDESADEAFMCKRGFLHIGNSKKKSHEWEPQHRVAHIKINEKSVPLQIENSGKEKQLTIKTQAVLLQEAIQTI